MVGVKYEFTNMQIPQENSCFTVLRKVFDKAIHLCDMQDVMQNYLLHLI